MENYDVEVEIKNDGAKTVYDLYSVLRPDIDKNYDEIEHYDARFIIKEPNGDERAVLSVWMTPDARPPIVPGRTAEEALMEDYATGKLKIPAGVSLNVPGKYINGMRLLDISSSAYVIGDVVIELGPVLSEDSIKNMYSWVWNRGRCPSSGGNANLTRRNKKDEEANANKNPNICLDLWSIPAFNGAKSSSNIKLYDTSTGAYRDWKRIVKMSSQDVILELE